MNNKTWLVKSAGSLLGPFSMEDVEAELRSKRIVVIDEIKTSQGRWKFIRECPEFTEIVNSLRDEQLVNDESSLTQTGITQPIPDFVSDDLTPTGPMNVEPQKPQADAKGKPAYGYAGDKKLLVSLSNEKKRVATLAWALVVVLIVVGAFALNTYNSKKSKSLTYKEALRRARIQKSLGNYEASLDLFHKAYAFKSPSPVGELEIVPLLMIVEKQNLQAQRTLEKLLATGILDEGSRLEADSLLALTLLRNGQIDEAQAHYKKILEVFPGNEAAQINLQEIAILKNQLDRTYADLTRMLKDGFREKSLVLYRALVALRIFDQGRNAENLERAVQDIERFHSKSQDYRPESLIIEAALLKKLKNEAALEKVLRELMVTNPDLTTQHRHDYLLHQEIFRWSYLGKICSELLTNSPNTLPFQGASIVCTYEQGDLKGALDLAERARNQFANEPLLYGLHAFLLIKSNRLDEANAIFQLPGARDYELALALHAQTCMDKENWSCAETDWKTLQERNSRSIEATVGLTKIAIESGRLESAQDWIKRGLMNSTDYKPLMELESQMHEP